MPSTLAPPRASPAVKQRAQALNRYLRRLREPDAASGAARSMLHELRADSWTRAKLERGDSPIDDGGVDGRELVAHGCAFLVKCHADLNALRTTTEPDRAALYTAQAELMLDVAIGKALLRELQPAIDQEVKAGDMAGAKGFTQFGHRLRKGVASAQAVISRAGRSDAERLADAMTGQPRETDPDAGALDQVARRIGNKHDQATRKRSLREAALAQIRLPSRTETLVAALACSLLIWAGLVQLPAFLDREPRSIVVEDYADTSVLEVVARPPSLYVTLDAATWGSADPATRDALLSKVVSVPLVDDDYRGALIKTSDGRPVAVWTRGGGIRALAIVEPSPRPEVAKKVAIFVP